MSDVKLGQLITEEVSRDAIHIAIIPVRATEILRPGQHVGLQSGSELFVGKKFKPHVGIVDPFLTRPVKKDDIFYLCLYQNTITGMRHTWEHPSFNRPKDIIPIKTETDLAKEGLNEVAMVTGVSYERLYSALELYAKYDNYTNNGDNEDYKNVSDYDRLRMWECFETLSGLKNPDKGYNCIPFSCSC